MSNVSYFTLRELVQAQVVRDIIGGVFAPGARLLEVELADRYGVSRGPVREALRALEAQGLVRSVRNKGFLVTRLTREGLREVYEIRAELEGLASEFSAPQLTDEDIREMTELLNAMRNHEHEPAAWIQLNAQFHSLFYKHVDRPRLLSLVSEFMNITTPYVRVFLERPGVTATIYPDHLAMVEAAKTRDPATVRAATRQHLLRSVGLMQPLIQGEPRVDDTEILAPSPSGEGLAQ